MEISWLYKSEAGQREVMAFYDTVLSAWPEPYQKLNVATRYGNTFVIASGEKSLPPLVLLHGASSNAVSWIGEAAAYSRHFRVYAVDIIGEPGRSAPARPSWIGGAYTEWMEDVFDGLGLESASLLGISQGAWVALKFAVSHPERVARLVLLTPAGITPARLSFILRVIPLTMLGKRGAEMSNRIVFGRQPIHPDVLKYMNAIMTYFKPRIGSVPLFTDSELQRLKMPVFLMVGERDALYPSRRIVSRLRTLVPHMEAIIDPEMGHVLFGISGRVLPFLTS